MSSICYTDMSSLKGRCGSPLPGPSSRLWSPFDPKGQQQRERIWALPLHLEGAKSLLLRFSFSHTCVVVSHDTKRVRPSAFHPSVVTRFLCWPKMSKTCNWWRGRKRLDDSMYFAHINVDIILTNSKWWQSWVKWLDLIDSSWEIQIHDRDEQILPSPSVPAAAIPVFFPPFDRKKNKGLQISERRMSES